MTKGKDRIAASLERFRAAAFALPMDGPSYVAGRLREERMRRGRRESTERIRAAILGRNIETAAVKGEIEITNIDYDDGRAVVTLAVSSFNDVFAGVVGPTDFAYAERMMLFWAGEADRLAKEEREVTK